MKTIKFWLFLMLVTMLAACGSGGSSGPEKQYINVASGNTTPPSYFQVGSEEIGVQGGQLKVYYPEPAYKSLNGLTLTFPEGSLSATTKVTVHIVKNAPELTIPKYSFVGTPFLLAPDQTTLNKSAAIDIPYDHLALGVGGVDEKNIMLLYYNPASKLWEIMPPGSYDDIKDVTHNQISKLGLYSLGGYCPTKL